MKRTLTVQKSVVSVADDVLMLIWTVKKCYFGCWCCCCRCLLLLLLLTVVACVRLCNLGRVRCSTCHITQWLIIICLLEHIFLPFLLQITRDCNQMGGLSLRSSSSYSIYGTNEKQQANVRQTADNSLRIIYFMWCSQIPFKQIELFELNRIEK